MLHCLKGESTRQHQDWASWLEAVALLNGRYLRKIEISPFEENELTLASMLAAGATGLGFLSFVELGIPKICGNEVAKPKNGRSDLWVRFSKKNSYSFEIKRAKFMANQRNLMKRMDAAIDNMSEVPDDEHDNCSAIMAAFDRDGTRAEVFEKFAKNDHVHLAYKLSCASYPNSYLFFHNL